MIAKETSLRTGKERTGPSVGRGAGGHILSKRSAEDYSLFRSPPALRIEDEKNARWDRRSSGSAYQYS